MRHTLLAGAAVAALLAAVAAPCAAKFLRPDLEDVPVARVIENLEAKAKKEPKNAAVRLNLARAHGMAYATKADTAKVWKGKEDDGVWFGYTPKKAPFEVKKTDEKKPLFKNPFGG